MSAMASQITGVSIVCSTVCSGAYQRKRLSSASLAFVRGIHRWSVDPPHKGPISLKMLPFLPEASFGLRVLSLPASVRPSVRPSVTKFVRAITHHPFKLGSPNLDHRCKRPWLSSLLFWGNWPQVAFKVKFNLKVIIYPILSLSAP